MKKYLLSIAIVSIALGCAKKKKEEFFPVLSYIKSQVAHVDTSFYQIIKINWKDSIHTDTTYVKREEFRNLAKDFLDIPDLSEKKMNSLYTEEKFYDQGLNRVVLTCIPKNPDNAIIQRLETLITPDPSGDKVKSFIIDLSYSTKDSSIQKRMLWKVDESFQVASIIQKPGQSEITHIMKVVWNEKDEK